MVSYGSGTLGPEGAATTCDPALWDVADMWVFGDSIAQRCMADLVTLLAPRVLAWDTANGRATTACVDRLALFLAEHPAPSVVLMLSGANDIFDPSVMPAQISRALSLLPESVLIWRDVQVCRTSQVEAVKVADQRNTGWVNLALHDAQPAVKVIEWARPLASKPSRLTAYLSDGVHPNTLGVAYHNAIIQQGLERLVPLP